jgi:arsenate reductase-like glutaredoxin family protein
MILLYFHKKNFDVQKAERWFSDRRIPIQKVDLTRAKLSRRELDLFARQVGMDALIDVGGAAWKECPARYAAGAEAVLEALSKDPRLLKLPIVRNGNRIAIGYRPEIWADLGAP